MASSARKKGNIANNRLYARAAERVHDQSLLNLFQKSCKGFMAFIPLWSVPSFFCFSLFASVSFFSAITFPHRYFSTKLQRAILRFISFFFFKQKTAYEISLYSLQDITI